MKASTVFALALALLIGLAAAAGAKYAGLFNRKDDTPPPPPPTPTMLVLVPSLNLYADVSVSADQVQTRPIRLEEEQYLRAKFGETWKEKLMPAIPTAAHQRTPRMDLVVDQILFKEHFHELSLPDPLSTRLEPNTRAVNVSVPRERAGGGVLRLNEHVDVFLTTRVSNGDRDELRTACIAKACKVIMKRNMLWTVMIPDPPGPLPFTLQANLYRAALIEYAQTVGTISLLPVNSPPRFTGSWSDPTSKEYATEDKRIEEILRGERTIGDDDLIRIFNVQPGAPRPVPPPPHKTEHIIGVSSSGVSVFPTKPQAAATQAPVVPAGGTGGTPNNTPNTTAPAPGDKNNLWEVPPINFRLPDPAGNPLNVDPNRTIGPKN